MTNPLAASGVSSGLILVIAGSNKPAIASSSEMPARRGTHPGTWLIQVSISDSASIVMNVFMPPDRPNTRASTTWTAHKAMFMRCSFLKQVSLF